MVKLLSLLISIIVSRDAEIIMLKKELKKVENSRKFYKKIAAKHWKTTTVSSISSSQIL